MNKRKNSNFSQKSSVKKNKKRHSLRSIKHLRLIVFTIIIFILLITRLCFIQFVNGEQYSEEANRQQTRNEILSPKRGTIYDSTGKILATSETVDTVSINPSFIKEENREKLAQAFADIFELDYNEMLAKVNSTNNVETIVKKVEKNKIDLLKKWMNDNKLVSGINIDEDVKRYYPYGTLASNLIGFCNSDNEGSEGLELEWNNVLKGTSGKLVSSIDALQQYIPDDNETYIPAQNGNDITLTIDANVQTVVEKYLKQAIEENNPKNGGTCIIMRPSNGDILAMATYPDYDLNSPRTPNAEYEWKWDSMSDEEKLNAMFKMWRNKCVSDTYEPGSTYKIITASIGLEEDIVEPDTQGVFYCKGYQQIDDETRINCWKTSGAHASESLRKALMNSCNPAMMQLGQMIGKTTSYKYYDAFGLFNKTGIQTSGESNSSYWDLKDVGPVELATMSFGQRFKITPIQLATAICCVANNGVLLQPRIVKEVKNTDDGTVKQVETTQVRQVLSQDTCSTMLDMLESVVSEGTGTYGQVNGYATAGKTGTSEPDPNHPEEGFTVSFVSIAPSENPEVVCLVALYGVDSNASGGGTVGPVVSQILSEVLPYLGIPSSNNTTEEESTIPTTILTDLRGKTIADAKEILEANDFVANIGSAQDEEIISDQVPKPGVSLPSNGQVFLYTESNMAERTTKTVPNIKGMTYEQAKSALNKTGFNISISGSGIVTSQEPSSGSDLEQGLIIEASLKPKSTDTH